MDDSSVINRAVEADQCYICLRTIGQQTVGFLEKCQHVFCLQCILQWSQTANTCPVDRISFGFICQRRCPGGAIQKKIKVRTKKKGEDDHDEEEESQAVICEECGRSDRRHRLLVCTHCDSGYHMDCLMPPLNTGREGDWICAECAVTPQHTEDSVVEVEISDGELTDLLAEADESESTGSRLRPSTINRSSSSTERRHSERVQSRADPLPLPQTSWHVPKYLLRASRAAVTTEEEAALYSATSTSASDKVNTRKRKKHAT